MNRRDFIKAVPLVAALPAIATPCEGDEEPFLDLPHENACDWPYRVYCYERKQGEWTFNENVRGSFSPEREYMTFEEDKGWPYAGWMDGGVLHFQTFDDATDFVDMHVRAKDDINLIDSIYDVYYKDTSWEETAHIETQVAHYWFNGDTGRQIHWETDGFNTNFNKVEFA